MKFLLDNLLLIALALVSGGLLLWPLIRKGGAAAALSPLEATQLINHRNAIVVDVRDDKDFQAGSLTGARNLPFAQLAERTAELVRFKGRPVLIVCDAGQQSSRAVATFKAQGFEDAHALAGGVAAWKAAGLPLVQPGRDTRPAANDGRRNRNESRGGRSKGGKPARPAAATPAVALAPINGVPAAAQAAAASSSASGTEATVVDPAVAPSAVIAPSVHDVVPSHAGEPANEPTRLKELS